MHWPLDAGLGSDAPACWHDQSGVLDLRKGMMRCGRSVGGGSGCSPCAFGASAARALFHTQGAYVQICIHAEGFSSEVIKHDALG